MSKCIACGKETAHSYPVYSARPVGKTVERFQTTSKQGVLTTTTYTDIVEHRDSLCTRCVHGKGMAIFMLIIGVAGLLLGAGLAQTAFSAGSTTFQMVGLGVMAAASLGIGVFVLYVAAKTFLDRGAKEDTGSISLFVLYKKQAKSPGTGKEWLTADQHRRMTIV